MTLHIRVEDVMSKALHVYGAQVVEKVFGRDPAESDWRFIADTPTGGEVTFHRGATAEDVAAYWKRERWEI